MSIAAMLAIPVASAQVVPPFTISASAIQAAVFPGETATFNVTVGNPPALFPPARDARMSAMLPAGWTANFSVDPVHVAAGGSDSTILSVFVPADAAPGVFSITIEAADDWNFTRITQNVTVKERPIVTNSEAKLPPPNVTLSVSSGNSGESGEIVQGELIIQDHDTLRPSVSVQISPAASNGWTPFVRDADRNRVLQPGDVRSIPIFVEVPKLTENATQELDINVISEGTTFIAKWIVLGIAPAPTVFDPSDTTSAGTSSATAPSTTSGSGKAPLNGPNLDVFVEPLELFIPSSGEQTAKVHLHNTGDTPLVVSLVATPPSQWRPFVFEPATPIELQPGERADVDMTLLAPDVPPGGAATATVTAVDQGFVRTAKFVIHVIPGPARDETQAATINAPAQPEGGVPIAGSVVLIGVGLAAVGGAAAIVASRPLREKFLWGAAGLYTRLARPDVLGHEDREKLYQLVERQPGIHFHALQRDLAWNTGTLTYHLRVLERHGFVVSRRDGLYRRFFLSGAAPRKETFEHTGPTGLRADVLEAVRNSPGISQSDLALALSSNKQTVNYHVKALERTNTIRVEKRGRDTYLFPADAPAEPGASSARA